MAELKKIMYAEDDEDIRTIVKICIDNFSNWEIEFAENGKILLDRVSDYNPDLILMDVMMPEMDGITTLKCLREKPQTSLIPVIIMSAKVQEAEIEEYKQQDILGVISKPFDPTQLVSQIEELWKNYQDKK